MVGYSIAFAGIRIRIYGIKAILIFITYNKHGMAKMQTKGWAKGQELGDKERNALMMSSVNVEL